MFPISGSNDSTFIIDTYRWYHKGMDRIAAEDMLKRIPYDGAFLVRRSEQDQVSFAISFRWEDGTENIYDLIIL